MPVHGLRAPVSMGTTAHFLANPEHFRRLAVLSAILAGATAQAQDALRHSLAGQAAAESRKLRLQNLPYNYKSGDFRLSTSASASFEWTDNANLQEDAEDDFILSPSLTLVASYPLTQRNLLSLSVSGGYRHYFDHDELSRWYIDSGSELAFDVFAGDFLFNLHDRFSFTQDAVMESSIAGTAEYGTFENVAGITTTWDLRDVVLTGGFDHLNSISTMGNFEYRDHASEMFLLRAGLSVHPELTTGLESTVSFTRYDQPVLNDHTAYSAGLYADYHPGRYFSVTPRVGYSIYDFDQTSESVEAKDLDAWYADIALRHSPKDWVSYAVNLGHELRMGVQSDAIESTYVRPSATWSFLKRYSLTTGAFYEFAEQKGGSPFGFSGEKYEYYGTNISLRVQPHKRLALALHYRATLRSSDVDDRDYTRNLVGITASYTP